MAKKMKTPIIAGNWKMYKTLPEAQTFLKEITPAVKASPSEVLLAVPFTMIQPLSQNNDSGVIIGAQNMNDAVEGAFTGEISARMLIDAGAKFVLLGHSERRQYFKETNDLINKKIKRAIQDGLRVIFCVGETFAEREEGQTEEVISSQSKEGLLGIDDLSLITMAYEPVWAIGTGLAASKKDASEAHHLIKNLIKEQVKVLYGGSVNPENAANFLKDDEIDGLLIGSASLNSDNFAKIIALTSEEKK